jgi:hypothetical protein
MTAVLRQSQDKVITVTRRSPHPTRRRKTDRWPVEGKILSSKNSNKE